MLVRPRWHGPAEAAPALLAAASPFAFAFLLLFTVPIEERKMTLDEFTEKLIHPGPAADKAPAGPHFVTPEMLKRGNAAKAEHATLKALIQDLARQRDALIDSIDRLCDLSRRKGEEVNTIFHGKPYGH